MENKTNLIINYLPQSFTDEELYSMFISIGPMKSAKIARDHKTGYSFGYGFVEYESAESAERAIAQLSGLQLQNKKIKVSLSRPSGSGTKEANLYVQNLGQNITEEKLLEIFSPFGEIVQQKVVLDPGTKCPKGSGFVRFATKAQADAAIAALHGTTPYGLTQSLNVRVAEEHGKQKAAYWVQQQQYAGGGMQQQQHVGGGRYQRNNGGGNNRFNPMARNGGGGGRGGRGGGGFNRGNRGGGYGGGFNGDQGGGGYGNMKPDYFPGNSQNFYGGGGRNQQQNFSQNFEGGIKYPNMNDNNFGFWNNQY